MKHTELNKALDLLGFSLETVFIIDGAKIQDKASFFAVFAEQLHFPDYFGFNWDGFFDCITDLGWLNLGPGFAILYQNPAHFRTHAPDEWQVAHTLLMDAISYWQQQKKCLLIAFY